MFICGKLEHIFMCSAEPKTLFCALVHIDLRELDLNHQRQNHWPTAGFGVEKIADLVAQFIF